MIRFHEWMKLKEGGVYDPLQRLAKTGDELYDSEEDMDYATKAGDRNDAIDDPKDDPHKGQLARSANDPRLRYPRVQQSGKTPGRGMHIMTRKELRRQQRNNEATWMLHGEEPSFGKEGDDARRHVRHYDNGYETGYAGKRGDNHGFSDAEAYHYDLGHEHGSQDRTNGDAKYTNHVSGRPLVKKRKFPQ